MSPEHTRILFERYPRLLGDPQMMRMIECGDGWFDLIDRALAKIEAECPRLATDPNYKGDLPTIFRIREKYGTLRIDVARETEAIARMVAEAETESEGICEACGAPGQLSAPEQEWLYVRCPGHMGKGAYGGGGNTAGPTRGGPVIWFCGDVHGRFGHVVEALEVTSLPECPAAVIFLGDLEPQEPLTKIFRRFLDAGVEPYFIHGNHEPVNADVWQNTLDGWHRNIHGRVETIAGVRIAGLGGTFRRDIWFPDHADMCDPAPKYETYDAYVNQLWPKDSARNIMLARQYSTAIFPAVVEELSRQRADVLVTHEAPSDFENGFAVIDDLARSLGVETIFNGHHHKDLSSSGKGFKAFQVGLRGIRELSGGIIRLGEPE